MITLHWLILIGLTASAFIAGYLLAMRIAKKELQTLSEDAANDG
jgi:hypothetical protein